VTILCLGISRASKEDLNSGTGSVLITGHLPWKQGRSLKNPKDDPLPNTRVFHLARRIGHPGKKPGKKLSKTRKDRRTRLKKISSSELAQDLRSAATVNRLSINCQSSPNAAKAVIFICFCFLRRSRVARFAFLEIRHETQDFRVI